ncbi:MAG TPA: hypothetical protein VII94_03820 [Candidatus Saccharimonadales bacterium]
MKSINHLLKLASRFEQILKKEAITMQAAPEDIENALKSANLFDTSNIVGPLLNTANIPADSSVTLNIQFDTKANPNYLVDVQPPNPVQSNKLANLLKSKFFSPMKSAITKANLEITNPIEIKWLKF